MCTAYSYIVSIVFLDRKEQVLVKTPRLIQTSPGMQDHSSLKLGGLTRSKLNQQVKHRPVLQRMQLQVAGIQGASHPLLEKSHPRLDRACQST